MTPVLAHTDVPPRNTLRVWWAPQVPSRPFYVPATDLAQAQLILNTLARYNLFSAPRPMHIKPDYTNTGGLEVFDGDGWFEWDDEDGNSIHDLLKNEDPAKLPG